MGVSYADTFVGLIDTVLAPEGIEVLNAGVNSYSPSLYFAKTRYLIQDVGLDFNELVVFLDMSDIMNEAKMYFLNSQGVVQPRKNATESPVNRLKDFFRRNSILYGFPRALKIWKKFYFPSSDPNKNNVINDPSSSWATNPEVYSEWGERGMKQSQKIMTRLKQLLDDQGIKMTLAVYPWPGQIYYQDINSGKGMEGLVREKCCAVYRYVSPLYFSG